MDELRRLRAKPTVHCNARGDVLMAPLWLGEFVALAFALRWETWHWWAVVLLNEYCHVSC